MRKKKLGSFKTTQKNLPLSSSGDVAGKVPNQHTWWTDKTTQAASRKQTREQYQTRAQPVCPCGRSFWHRGHSAARVPSSCDGLTAQFNVWRHAEVRRSSVCSARKRMPEPNQMPWLQTHHVVMNFELAQACPEHTVARSKMVRPKAGVGCWRLVPMSQCLRLGNKLLRSARKT